MDGKGGAEPGGTAVGATVFYVTNKRVAETEAIEEEFRKRFIADLMRLSLIHI